LIYCDVTISPDGEGVSVADRLAEIEKRYGVGSVVGRFIRHASRS
jgi:hypothetical protein